MPCHFISNYTIPTTVIACNREDFFHFSQKMLSGLTCRSYTVLCISFQGHNTVGIRLFLRSFCETLDSCLLKSVRLVNVGFRHSIKDFDAFKVRLATNNNELRLLYTAECVQ